MLTRITAALLLCATFAHAADKPNIVFVLADDLGWADVGYNGATFYETPHIDALAKDGVRFNRFYPGGPNCAPTRGCLLTGTYTPRHQLYQPSGKSKGDVKKMRWKVPTRGQDASYDTFHSNDNTIEARWVSIAEVLKPAGYATARIGKWHLGDDDQGFDLSTNDGARPFAEHNANHYSDVHVAEKMTDRAIEFIEDNKDRPFFLYVSHWEVHTPIKATKDLVDKYKQKKADFTDKSFNWNPTYAAEIEVVDRSVGRLRAKLKELGLDRNTVFIFSSDNGGLTGVTPNKPLHAGKGSLFEGGIRTPFAAAWPANVKPGSETDVPVTGVDLLPTLAALAGAALPTGQPVDGVSFAPLLAGKPIADRAIFWHYPLYLAGGKGNKVLPVYGTDEMYWRAVPSSAIMKGDWKLIHYYEYEKHKLFNLKSDPGEQQDLAGSNPQKAKALYDELMAWVERTDAPVSRVPNPAFVREGKRSQ